MSEILINKPDPENLDRWKKQEWAEYTCRDSRLFEDIARYLVRGEVYHPRKKWQPLGVGLALALFAGSITSYLVNNSVEGLAVAASAIVGTTGFLVAYHRAQLLAETRDIRRENTPREYPQSYDLDL